MGQTHTSSSSGTYIAHVVEADIRPVNDQVPSVETKDHNDSLIAQVNSKTVENADLKRSDYRKRNSKKNRHGSNDLFIHHYLEEARKKTQERNMNSKPSVMHTTGLQNTTNGSKPNPRSNNQISRSLHVSKSSSGMSNEVNSRAKVQSLKTRNNNKPVEPKESYTSDTSRQIAIGQRVDFSKLAGLRWIPTGKMFIDSTTKVDSEPPNGSNEDSHNHMNASLFNDKMTSVHISSGLALQRQMTSVHISSGLALQRQMASADNTSGPRDYEILFQPLFDEYFNPPPCAISPDPVAVAAPRPVDPAGSHLSTTIDQDVPSASTSPTNQEIQF
ncbi:hypothetical protein Tco_1029209 [Tanacetum coccineum]|uniref:Uncharacterized protein n=1 Tax=Tanacetum coccineum TaxID=301880 RepID=A0ABQ5G4C0_9ASTR